MITPARLPDAASLETVLAGLDPASADTDLVPALNAAFPGFAFGLALIDDDYWRDTRSIIRPDGTRIGELRPWMTAELAKEKGDTTAVWRRLKESDLQITEWRGTSAFVSAPTGPGAADYLQIALGREIEWRAGPIVNPDFRPYGESELLDPSRPRRDPLPDTDRLAGPIYRLLDRARQSAPRTVEELVAKLEVGTVQKVLQNLLREQVALRDLPQVLELLADASKGTDDVAALTEAARAGLARE